MSYESHSVCDPGIPLKKVKELVELLGYVPVDDRIYKDEKGAYMWFDTKDYQSWVGVELTLFKEAGKPVLVYTRSRAGRSFWDLSQQNKTLRLVRDLLGGTFTTDAGKNRYWHPDGPPPKPVASGCYLARWRFQNAMIKPRLYLSQRGLDQPNAKGEPTGHWFIDEMNPRLFSNNLLMPYLIAVWEDFLKASFIAMLSYSPQREAALKRARLNQNQLEMIATGTSTIEVALAESLSFQRPSVIANNYKLIDPHFNLATQLRKPYRRRNKSLFEAIDDYVDLRNDFVHTGRMSAQLLDKEVAKAMDDFEVAVDRCYAAFGKLFDFAPIQRF
jgi:hypothetical protein